MPETVIRATRSSDRSALRRAVVDLQNYERSLHDSRRPGEAIAEAYLEWMLAKARASGAVLIAEVGGEFAGLAAGWIEQEERIQETDDSNRFGFISDVYVLPEFRGRRVASQLIEGLDPYFRRAGVRRVRMGVLAANRSARAAYEYTGFAPYEVIYERLLV
jgi:ribosomal protein S18 acetylase RimI-like enzyme